MTLNNQQMKIHHQLMLTMIDGKICNVLSKTSSSQTCYICRSTPKSMNITQTAQNIEEKYYEFGISSLHGWIRCFECLLHISYRLDIKAWQVKSESMKANVAKRKEDIQNKFKMTLGLIIDRPKQGFGSTNDGNTARTFFKNYEKSAEITGLDKNLILKFSVILQALSSGHEIDISKFEKYAKETKDLYLNVYPWFYMPVTVHKILVHGSEIIKSCKIPIGQLSEDAQEARHKDCRRFREFHTPKISRESTNKDLLRMLLISSDPVVNSFRTNPQKPSSIFSPEVLSLLKSPDIHFINNGSNEEDDNLSVSSED